MNQYEFYSNFFKYRGRKEDLQHASTYGDYYYKIENYYGPGNSRYFKTKDEYDAYVREQEKQYNKTKEELAQNKINKFTSGRDAAIKKSSNWKDSYIKDEVKKQNETAKQLQGSSSTNAKGYGNEYQKYLNKGYSDTLPGAQRAKKEKENAEKAAKRSTLLKTAQGGREAAINNSYKMSDEEVEKAFDKDKKWQEEQEKIKKNPVYAAMKSMQKKIKRAEEFNEQQASKQRAINNSEKISDEEWQKRLKADEEYQKLAKMPGGKAMADTIVAKKTALNASKNENVNNDKNNDDETEKAAANARVEAQINKEKEEASRKELRKIQLEELNDNAEQFKNVLQKLKNGGDTLTKSQLQSLRRNPLYQALNQSLSDDESFDIIDYVNVGGMWGNKRIEAMEKSIDDLVATLEKSINNGTISNTGTTNTVSNTTKKEQPRPGRGAI